MRDTWRVHNSGLGSRLSASLAHSGVIGIIQPVHKTGNYHAAIDDFTLTWDSDDDDDDDDDDDFADGILVNSVFGEMNRIYSVCEIGYTCGSYFPVWLAVVWLLQSVTDSIE